MALDGIVLSNIASDLKKLFIGGRVLKIYQTEEDEIIMGVRGKAVNHRLLLTAHSNYPRVHITNIDKENPQSPPMFCMLLRKHIGGGRIIDIIQPDFDRILEFHIESTNELGDLTTKQLIIEIMGRHSNIILVEDGVILDSIKRISKMQSSVREVLPGMDYEYPPSQNKSNPLNRAYDDFIEKLDNLEPNQTHRQLYTIYAGMSPLVAREICHRANVPRNLDSALLTPEQKKFLYDELDSVYKIVEDDAYTPGAYEDAKGQALAFSSIELTGHADLKRIEFEDCSALLEYFYFTKITVSRVSQKTSNMKRLLQVQHERTIHREEIQLQALSKVKKRDLYRVWGELITANAHSVPERIKSFTTINYYDEAMPDITIPLDPDKTPIENAQYYFKKYNKAKRTEVAAKKQLRSIKRNLYYIDSLFVTLDTLETETDIEEFRSELISSGYLKKKTSKNNRKQRNKKPKPLHFKSSDGFDMFVGKNNVQNDHLTLRTAENHDIWFHTKEIPGSHVIIITNRKEVPETTILEAAYLAAYHSKARSSSNVPVDYTEKKFVRKPNGAKPGMVIYSNNKTAYVTPTQKEIDKIKNN